MDSQASSTSSHKGKGKKKPCAPPEPQTPPQGTSDTSSSLPAIPASVEASAPSASYFYKLFLKNALELGLPAIPPKEEILRDYRKSIDGLREEIDALSSELDQLRVSPQPPTTTESPSDTHIVLESTSAPTQQPATSAPIPTSVGAPSWATVVKRGKKKATTATQKPAPAAKLASPANAPAPKKGVTMRERRLVIKRNCSPLTPTAMELLDTINSALSSTYIQTVSLTGGNVTLTTMETAPHL
ncbi:hypothetical protein L873DRAFT_1792021 [Choiromyces venosus 120613-1]|uniref:Uncharacterized protein n=1 Tax=Choiromyces venosus 120613-1 TaxID=1336337 RepID=A0A3N4JCD4_9PEZI|nr:hypothetical protein L873DRAFT_1792021 [Choiromyces venosus 120613-1]